MTLGSRGWGTWKMNARTTGEAAVGALPEVAAGCRALCHLDVFTVRCSSALRALWMHYYFNKHFSSAQCWGCKMDLLAALRAGLLFHAVAGVSL